MANRSKEEMVRLGLLGLLPFVVAAVVVWLSPWLVPLYVALDFHQFALIYGAAIVCYLAGAGAGAFLAPQAQVRESFIPGQLIVLVAVIAALPNGVFYYSLGGALRHFVILVLLIYLLMRDIAGASIGALPKWYANLRIRLTFWAGLAIMLIISRLVLLGYY